MSLANPSDVLSTRAPDYDYLEARPELVQRWQAYSWDIRGAPSHYMEGVEVGLYDAGYRDVVRHSDSREPSACADFIVCTTADPGVLLRAGILQCTQDLRGPDVKDRPVQFMHNVQICLMGIGAAVFWWPCRRRRGWACQFRYGPVLGHQDRLSGSWG